MRKFKLRECEACFYKYTKHKGYRISRKDKKELKKLLEMSLPICHEFDSIAWNKCDMKESIKYLRSIRPILNKIQGNLPIYQFIIKEAAKDCEDAKINGKGLLCWYWEDDSDFAWSSGLMPFVYIEDPKDKTWSFRETKQLICWGLYKGTIKNIPSEIVSDDTLIQYIKTHPLPKDQLDYDI